MSLARVSKTKRSNMDLSIGKDLILTMFINIITDYCLCDYRVPSSLKSRLMAVQALSAYQFVVCTLVSFTNED